MTRQVRWRAAGAARIMNAAVEQSLLLPAGALAGLIWANAAARSYDRFAAALRFVVNDVGMVFFFALAAKEVVEAAAPGGALSSARRAAVPIMAALGGMAAPAGAHDTLSQLEHWWKVPVELILFAFGLVNAGVAIDSAGPGTTAVLAAVLIGKPVGIAGFTLLARGVGLHLPAGLGWREILVRAAPRPSASPSRCSSPRRRFRQGPSSRRRRPARC